MNIMEINVGIFMRVYRNEPTIHRAINSVLSQSYEKFKYYILVNENTRSIVKEYEKKDKRIVMMEGKPNEGFITYAKDIANENEYVTTIDADDWYDKTYIEQLLSIAEVNHVDIVACGNYFFVGNNKIIGERKQKTIVWEKKDTNKVLPFVYGHFRTIWGKLYRSNVIIQSNFQNIPESNKYGGYGGDTLFVYNLFPYARKFCVSDKTLYYYQVSQTSGSRMLNKGRMDSDEILFDFIENILNKFEGYGDNQRRYLFWVYGYALIDTVKLLLEKELTEKEMLEKILYILEKPQSRELFMRQEKGYLVISGLVEPNIYTEDIKNILLSYFYSNRVILKETSNILRILEILYPKLRNTLCEDEFSLLIKNRDIVEAFILRKDMQVIDKLLYDFERLDGDEEICCLRLLQKLNSNIIFKTLLHDGKFLKAYSDIALLLNNEKYAEVTNVIKSYFSGDTYPYKAEELVYLWNNIAAKLENIEEYIFTLQLKVEILYIVGKKEEAINQFEELVEMNIQDEIMENLNKMILEEI